MQLTADLSALKPEVRNRLIHRLQREDEARYAIGVTEQIRMKKLRDEMVKTGAYNEVGPMTFIASDDQYQRAMHRYGQLCFMDPDFVPWLLKHNEDMRVKNVGTRIQSGYTKRSLEPIFWEKERKAA